MMIKNIKLTLFLFILYSCNGQNNKIVKIETDIISPVNKSFNRPNNAEDGDGVIYFSDDNGMTWINRSKGLPQKASIGLGGIAVSATMLGVAACGIFIKIILKYTAS